VSAPYGCGPAPLVVAHRGGAGLAAENTLEAFDRSYALGVRYLETDVRVSADGVCVAFHDADTARLTGVPGRLAGREWDGLRQLRVRGGPGIPRLEELLTSFPGAWFMLDLKDPRAIGPLARVLREHGALDRVCLGGSSDRWLSDVRAVLGGEVATALGWESLTRLATAARFGVRPRGLVPAPFAHVPLRLGGVPVFVERLVSLAHDAGSRVLVWTVDTPAAMHRLFDAGVDGIISDRPDVLLDVVGLRSRFTGGNHDGGGAPVADPRSA
jgi:glycerophosphoryl diester phosphodiesterase